MFGLQYVLGAVYVLTILYLPMGLMGIPEQGKPRRREKDGTTTRELRL